jgi:phosphatidylserine decarboxylase
VSGQIIKATTILGSFFSNIQTEDFDITDPLESQCYITHVGTRASIFIEADNPDIGLMCVMPVGMRESASCGIRVREGQRVEKWEELRMFHGGSTHCLIFGPKVDLVFDLHG